MDRMGSDGAADTLLKVFLVDDEIVVREGIRNHFPWEDAGFSLCGEAPDGEIALSMIQELRPDILVTDIRMPFMDGMALCRAAAAMPWMHIIILSGYDDFAYAREAISLGVKEYLLKPVSVLSLRQALERVAGMIAEERARRADLDSLRRRLSSSNRLAKERLVSRVFDGTFTEGMNAEARAAGLTLSAKYYVAMILEPTQGGELLELRAALERLADGSGGAVALTERGAQLWALVLGDSGTDAEERVYACAQAVAHETERSMGKSPRIAIGSIVSSLDDAPKSIRAAMDVLKAPEARDARILGVGDVSATPPEMANLELTNPGLLKLEVTPLYESLRFASIGDIPRVVTAYFESFGGMAAQSLLVAHYALVDIMLAGCRIVKSAGGEPSEVLPEAVNESAMLLAARAADDVISMARDLLTRALAFRDSRAGSGSAAVVRKACAYIDANYQRPEITLNDIARHVGLSNNHFCTVFSQKMGVTFLEYLTRLRMDKARALLIETDLRSSDIAELIGYTDTRYFRYLFKRSAGMPPREYREAARPLKADTPSN